MQLSFNGLEALKEFEGFKDIAYKDTGGVWTIGYGTTVIDGKPVCQGQRCTQKEAAEWLRQDAAASQTAVNQMVKVPLKQNQFDALVSFVYNVGVDGFRKSTLLRKLNARQYAAGEFDRWVYDNGKKIDGLVKRRAKEREMFEA